MKADRQTNRHIGKHRQTRALQYFAPSPVHVQKISRAVRKTLFMLKLGRPARDLVLLAHLSLLTVAAAASGRHVSQPRSADSSMCVAWLNLYAIVT